MLAAESEGDISKTESELNPLISKLGNSNLKQDYNVTSVRSKIVNKLLFIICSLSPIHVLHIMEFILSFDLRNFESQGNPNP